MAKEEKEDNLDEFILQDEIDLSKLISFLFKNRMIFEIIYLFKLYYK